LSRHSRALLIGVSCAISAIALSSAAVQVAPPSAAPSPSARSLEFPSSRSAAPDAAEWSATPAFELSRRIGAQAKLCEARKLREWVRLRCGALRVSAITELGGSAEGVRLRLDPKSADGLPAGGELVFPMRPGERRVFSFWTLGEGYDGPLTVIPALVAQSDWSGEHPFLVLHDALNEPVRTAQSERRRLEPKPLPSSQTK
jgi:hypothetical protein